MYEGGMQRLCAGLSHEGAYTGVALGEIHAPRMHILPEVCRRLHNKSHQTKIFLIREVIRNSGFRHNCVPEKREGS